MHSLIQENLFRIPNTVDLVVGIPRSGLIPASHIATSLNLPLQSLTEVSTKSSTKQLFTLRDVKPVETPHHILIVDDTSNTGGRLNQANNLLNARWKDIEITSLVMSSAKNATYSPDIAFTSSNTPRIFAWNMFNHPEMTSKIAVDLDGILCIDPTHEQNDDAEKYQDFLRNAKLKIRPNRPIRAIITGRLEKYRLMTSEWLFNQSIEYTDLIMNDAPTAEFRKTKKYKKAGLKIDQISDFKCRIIEELKPPLFVESNFNQASNIYKITGTNTYAFDDDHYFGSKSFS
jgi:hypoxanthine phosphoribosyltransferase